MENLIKEERIEVEMNYILRAGTQSATVSDVWSMWTEEKDDEIFN